MFSTTKLSLSVALVIVYLSANVFAIDCREEIHPDYLKVDVPSLIHIKNHDDAKKVRKKIIDYLWKAKGYPARKLPVEVTTEFPTWLMVRDIGSKNVARVERLRIEMDYGLHSEVYLFHPKKSANRLLIFHQGHRGFHEDLMRFGARETIRFFLDKNFSVLVCFMPFKDHNRMSRNLENEDGSFIRFFLEPVVVAINHMERNHNYYDINMVGISGGGWTANLCAAIEPRISVSFCVSGSVPLYLRKGPCINGSRGDAEQNWPALYEKTASWLDIYILGGYGKGRKMVQIYNKYDGIFGAVNKLGKDSFSAYLDVTHREHKISQHAIDKVIWPTIKSRKFK